MRRVAHTIMALLVAVAPVAALAKSAGQRFAAIAVVEATGEVLHARHADAPRHPASLTKVMTLYLVFEAIKAGELGWDDRLRISKKAASAHPARLGLIAGQSISVEDAVRALVTKSANDAAIVLAERLGGGEAVFATQMNRKARQLGMRHSHFVNASGLHSPRQVTTARDMAILTYRIRHDFPAQFRYFSLSKMVWNGHEIPNHNALLGRVAGVDGLKTGFTNASGYNIIVTAERDGERLIAVVFGGASAAQRDAYATRLLERAFAVLASRRAKSKPAPGAMPPDLNDRAPVLVAGLPGEAAQGASERRGVRIVIDDSIETRPLPGLKPSPGPGIAGAAAEPGRAWAVQVGAFMTRAQAEARLRHVNAISLAALSGRTGRIIAAQRNGSPLYRVRYAGLDSASAHRICATLNAAAEPCFAVPPMAAAMASGASE